MIFFIVSETSPQMGASRRKNFKVSFKKTRERREGGPSHPQKEAPCLEKGGGDDVVDPETKGKEEGEARLSLKSRSPAAYPRKGGEFFCTQKRTLHERDACALLGGATKGRGGGRRNPHPPKKRKHEPAAFKHPGQSCGEGQKGGRRPGLLILEKGGALELGKKMVGCAEGKVRVGHLEKKGFRQKSQEEKSKKKKKSEKEGDVSARKMLY